MHYSSDEIEAMGEGGEVGCCAGDDMEGDWWQSQMIPMSGISTTEIVRPVRQDQSLGDPFPLEAIIRQTTNDGSHFVGETFVGATFVGEDGSVYGVDDMGFVKKTARGVRRGAGSVARRASRTANVVPGVRQTSRVVERAGKKVVKTHVDAAKFAGKGATIATKAVAKAAATPIRLAARPGYRALLKKHKGNKARAKTELLTRFGRSGNPAAKFAGLVLRHTGISGDMSEPSSEMGLTGAEISAMASAAVAAITPIVRNIVTDVAKDQAGKLTEDAVNRAIGARTTAPMSIQIPPEESPEAEAMAIATSDQAIDNALDAEPTDESSGWEAGCCI
jgi:hypothetical protein